MDLPRSKNGLSQDLKLSIEGCIINMKYAVLYNPGHSRVYFETALKLSIAEFSIAAQKISARCDELENQQICGVYYLTFKADDELTASDIKIISGLSFVYAMFILEDDGRLNPVAINDEKYIDSGISGILKYSGKTNEIFTRMLVNIAYYSQGAAENIRLLDPISGKGTTLYEGLVKGFNVYGIEIGEKVTAEAYHFLQKYLENEKYKFNLKSIKLSGEKKSFTAERHTFEIARNKQELKDKNIRTAEFISGNSQFANKYYKKNFFNMIVGDLPYGIQHGNVTNEKQSSLTRNPTELLNVCLPSWAEVLKPGGSIVLSWNSFVLSRVKMIKIFEDKGLKVRDDEIYRGFEHRVDQSIMRDIIVAVK